MENGCSRFVWGNQHIFFRYFMENNIETGKTAEIVHAGGRKRRGNNRSDGGNYTGSNCLCNGIYICIQKKEKRVDAEACSKIKKKFQN